MNIDGLIHNLFDKVLCSDQIRWRTVRKGIQYYYAEDGLYILRNINKLLPPVAFVLAKSPDEATQLAIANCEWAEPDKEGGAE
jgi:hypothetical protein